MGEGFLTRAEVFTSAWVVAHKAGTLDHSVHAALQEAQWAAEHPLLVPQLV